MKRKLFLLVFFIQTASVTWSQNGTDPILVTDMLRIQQIGQLDLSPDRQKMLFTVQRIIERENDKNNYDYDNQLWIGNTSGQYELRQLTYSKDNPSQAKFSPDGQSILFVRTVKEKPQLFMMSLSGGEPKQITDFKYGATSPTWSPDGKKILFSSAIKLDELLQDSVLNPNKLLPEWDAEKPGYTDNNHLRPDSIKANPDGSIEEIRAYLLKNEQDKKAKVINKLQFQGEASTSGEFRFNHLFVLDAEGDKAPELLTSGFYSYADPHFINNREILVNAKINEKEIGDRVLESAVYRISLETKELKTVFSEKDKSFFVEEISPSGRYAVYAEANTGTPNVPKVHIYDLQSEKVLMNIDLDRNMGNFKWTSKEDELYFTALSNGGAFLYRLGLKDGKVKKLSAEDEGIGDFVVGDGKLLYVKTSVANPSELEEADLNMKNNQPISSFNSSWLKDKKLSLPEKHHFTNEEGMEVEYWVMKPSNFQESHQYPLLLEIHGGPSAMWGPGEGSMWHEYQYFCSQGYGIVYSNPRGSGGYGEQFLRANMNNWGKGPTSDVLEALDRTVDEGWADTGKLLITGGSYAGYLVSWIVGHDQRFKAACSQRGVYDLKTFFGEGNAWRLVPNYFGGYPWEEETLQTIDRESPINYVQNIHTPYIIFHGENDLRTGVIQSEMLYKSLKVLGRPVEYVRHPGATHEITRSGDNRQRIDQLLRTYEFFERFVR
ncbi:S9 family peptidase [Olivibacter sp. SDN3]|uniref:S9 family peptidase n=1 Tax=Olivibacter sp. SDN3 TaxID=2764720 RepID=UPI001650E684|nr:S9 family peptidase [Olivibacter sp. SDN3]QNL48714.1 S9 family peptidase [Olivibacter sp. SDN3]